MRDGFYEVREVYELTGLNRKQLHQCDNLGLIKPTRLQNDAGYKLYDEEALNKLLEIGLYAALGLSIQEIKLRMTSIEYDRWKILEEITSRCRTECEHLRNRLAIAEQLSIMKCRIPEYDSYVICHMDELGEKFRNIKES